MVLCNFSDEPNFEVLNCKGKLHAKRYKHEKYSSCYVIPRLQGGRGLCGIWGCISREGPGLSKYTPEESINIATKTL